MDNHQVPEAQSFIQWLSEIGDLLKKQIQVAESLQKSLTHFNIEQTALHLELQQGFLEKAELWYKQCWDYWIKLGYPEASGETGLSPWLELKKIEWVDDPLANQLFLAWFEFRMLLIHAQELNGLNQTLVEELSNDTRRKLHTLLEFIRGGSPLYTAEGNTDTGDKVHSSILTGRGRLLAKG